MAAMGVPACRHSSRPSRPSGRQSLSPCRVGRLDGAGAGSCGVPPYNAEEADGAVSRVAGDAWLRRSCWRHREVLDPASGFSRRPHLPKSSGVRWSLMAAASTGGGGALRCNGTQRRARSMAAPADSMTAKSTLVGLPLSAADERAERVPVTVACRQRPNSGSGSLSVPEPRSVTAITNGRGCRSRSEPVSLVKRPPRRAENQAIRGVCSATVAGEVCACPGHL